MFAELVSFDALSTCTSVAEYTIELIKDIYKNDDPECHHYVHSALNCLNKDLLETDEKPMKMREFVAKFGSFYSYPNFEKGILAKKKFVFMTDLLKKRRWFKLVGKRQDEKTCK